MGPYGPDVCHSNKHSVNMASTEPFVLVKLTDEDVPGAACTHSLIEYHTVMQLKRWLACGGMRTSGTKPQLVQ